MSQENGGAVELGVDLGTSSTVAFLRRDDGTAEPVLFDGAPLLPSAVHADEAGRLLVGRDAIHSARARPERFEGNPKRRIDDGAVFLGVEVSVENLLAALLHRVFAEAARIAGAPVTAVTVCHPAAWGPGRRATLQRAATAAGFTQTRLVPEPVAAAAFHLRRHGTGPADLLIYDLGAGTFDVAVVRYAPGTAAPMSVLCSGGLDDTGGQDVDAAIVSLLRARGGPPELWARLDNPATVADRAARRQLWDDVRGAKEMLSRSSSTNVYLPLLETDHLLTRAEVERTAEPLIQRTLNAIMATLSACPAPLAPLSGAILVGGASRMPLVATMLHRALNLAPTIIDQPELVVAAGSVDPLLTGRPLPPPAPAPQTPPSPPHLSPQAPQASPHLSPQAPQASPHLSPQAPQASPHLSPQAPQASPHLSPQAPQASPHLSPQAPQASPHLSPQAPQASPHLSPQAPQASPHLSPQAPQASPHLSSPPPSAPHPSPTDPVPQAPSAPHLFPTHPVPSALSAPHPSPTHPVPQDPSAPHLFPTHPAPQAPPTPHPVPPHWVAPFGPSSAPPPAYPASPASPIPPPGAVPVWQQVSPSTQAPAAPSPATPPVTPPGAVPVWQQVSPLTQAPAAPPPVTPPGAYPAMPAGMVPPQPPAMPAVMPPPGYPAAPPGPGMPVGGSGAVITVVELISVSTPRYDGITLRGQLHAGFGVVEHVFPTDPDGRLLLFADAGALGRHAALHAATEPLMAVPPWRVRNDGSDDLHFDLDLLPAHLGEPPERWLPAYVCRCRDLGAQLAIFLDLEGADDLVGEHSTIDSADDILRRHRLEPTAAAARRKLARLDRAQLLEDWRDLITLIDEAIVHVS
ncbi:Hsp70 family protein [Dactylosporangium sp. CA-233914]|uniref:Hsp70 family protein n=1 Tax=Dactylosporangium sp. CA-233914 TaxID=3239934 RepID=UPI003D922126